MLKVCVVNWIIFFSAITKSHPWILPTCGNHEMLEDEQLLLLQIRIWRQWHMLCVQSFWISIGKWKNTKDVAFCRTSMVYVNITRHKRSQGAPPNISQWGVCRTAVSRSKLRKMPDFSAHANSCPIRIKFRAII